MLDARCPPPFAAHVAATVSPPPLLPHPRLASRPQADDAILSLDGANHAGKAAIGGHWASIVRPNLRGSALRRLL